MHLHDMGLDRFWQSREFGLDKPQRVSCTLNPKTSPQIKAQSFRA